MSQPTAPLPDHVPLLDVGRENHAMRDEIAAAILNVCDSGRFLHGPDCRKLEEAVASCTGAKHGVSCASGSDALLLALMAVDLKPGDEVICPSFTFFATASAVSRLGAKPVFVDIDPQTFNIDVSQIEAAVTPSTKAIIPVHLFGQCADLPAIREIGERHGLTIIEDVAQAIGAKFQDRGAGSWGDIGCFSFYPTKNLGGFGDGGMLTTNSDDIADRLQLLAGHGMRPRYNHSVIGINSRLDSIQAAVLNVKMTRLPDMTLRRQANATFYHELFQAAGIEDAVTIPQPAAGCEHVWNQFTIRVPNGRRDELRQHLTSRGVGSEIYYPIPLHQQECFRSLGYAPGSLPETERAAGEVLSLPIFPDLLPEEQEAVVAGVSSFFAGEASQAA